MVLNSTLHNGNMKVLRSFICLNSYMVFKDPECPTYTISITHHNSFYVYYFGFIYIVYSSRRLIFPHLSWLDSHLFAGPVAVSLRRYS